MCCCRSGADTRTKRQRFESGDASVDAYMAHLAAPPEAQQPQHHPPIGGDNLDVLSGGVASGSAGPALRSRSIQYEDDLDDDTPGAFSANRGSKAPFQGCLSAVMAASADAAITTGGE